MKKYTPTILDYPMPDSLPIEHKILASCITYPMLLADVIGILKTAMFSAEETQELWRKINDMYYNHEEISLMTIMPKVNRKYFMENIVRQLPEATPRGILSLVSAFIDTYTKRQGYVEAVRILQGITSGQSGEQITASFDNFSKNLASGFIDTSMQSAMDAVNALATDLEQNTMNKMPTYIPTLDRNTYGGFGGGNLVILAARPSVGKTTIAMQFAQESSLAGKNVLVFSLEMTSKELVQRMILSTGLVTPYEIYSHNINWDNFDQAVHQAVSNTLSINDKSNEISDIRQKIILACQSGKCDMVMIDYLQLIKGANPRLSLAQQVSEYTSALKQVAKQCNIPIILLSQLNRSSASEDRSPQLFDLRDSGAIEQDADIVLMLERSKDDGRQIIENSIDMWIRKNRGGKCNFDSPIRLQGNNVYSNFKEIEYDNN